MTYRRQPIFPNQIYHVFNRSVALQPIFLDVRDYKRFLDVVNFYRFVSPGLRFSYYDQLLSDERTTFMEKLQKNGVRQVEIFAFCLMPNHFHFLLKEVKDNGIKKFSSNLQNSYAKYFNTKRKRSGSLFQEMFKAVRIESDEQLIHVTRYIHLNPFTSFLVKNINQLRTYPWSSLNTYLGMRNFDFLETDFLMGFFPSKEKFQAFTLDQANYQRQLEEIKHLTLENLPEV